MLISHRGQDPTVGDDVFVAPTAVLAGRITIARGARVMYGAVLDSEGSSIEVGETSVICEHAVLRATAEGSRDHPVRLGDHVFVGPHATLLGCSLDPAAYIATGATVLQGARIGAAAAVGVGALVHANAVVPDEFFVPPGAVAIGRPVRLYSAADPAALAKAIRAVGFAKAAFGVDAGWEDRRARYRQAAEVRAAEFGAHGEDRVLPG